MTVNLFVFDKDGFYDIVERNKSEVDYLINDVSKYDIKELIEERNRKDEEDDGDDADNRMEKVEEEMFADIPPVEETVTKEEPADLNSEIKSDETLIDELFGDETTEAVNENFDTKSEVTETQDTFEDDFNFDDIDFNFDDILNDESKEDEIADTVEITNVAYKEAAEEKGIPINENEYGDDFDFFDDELIKSDTRQK